MLLLLAARTALAAPVLDPGPSWSDLSALADLVRIDARGVDLLDGMLVVRRNGTVRLGGPGGLVIREDALCLAGRCLPAGRGAFRP